MSLKTEKRNLTVAFAIAFFLAFYPAIKPFFAFSFNIVERSAVSDGLTEGRLASYRLFYDVFLRVCPSTSCADSWESGYANNEIFIS